MNLNELRDRAYRCACEHGFHDTEYPDYHWLMLTICELGEAVEADRKDRHADRERIERIDQDPVYGKFLDSSVAFRTAFKDCIKDTVEDEMADVVIRLLDFAGLKKIDLAKVQKHIEKNRDKRDYSLEMYKNVASIGFATSTILTSIVLGKKTIVKYAMSFVLEFCNKHGIDLEWHIEQKMRYNELRPHLNGKKY